LFKNSFCEYQMWKFAAYLMCAACASGLGIADAAYVIKLKNGNMFVTARYWQEGGQILFETYGGVFGVDRSLVTKIEQSDKPIRLVTAPQKQPEEKPLADADKEQKAEKRPSNPSEPQAQTRAEDDPVAKEFNSLKAQFSGLGTMLTDEMSEYLKKLSALKSKIQGDRKINQYIQEYTELINMAGATEAALRSRR